jgi:branched-chain amino acid transport system permease protein
VTVVAPLHARHRLGQPILVATAALSIAIQEFLRLSGGAHEHWFPSLLNDALPLARAGTFVVTVTPMQLIIAAAGLGAAGAVLRLLARSRFGREWRAFADDPGAAALFGVAPRRLLASTFVLAGALAGLAGWVITVYYGNVGFAMGTTLGLKALVAAVLGGIGSVPGAFLGGVLVALIEAMWSAYFDIGFRDVVVFSLLIVVFVLRPGGLLGFSGPRPREV